MKTQQYPKRGRVGLPTFIPLAFVTALVLLLALAPRTALAANGRYQVRAVCDIQIVNLEGEVEKSGTGYVEAYGDTLPVTINLKQTDFSDKSLKALRAALQNVGESTGWVIKEVGSDFNPNAQQTPHNNPESLTSNDTPTTRVYDKNPVYYWVELGAGGLRVIANYSVTAHDTQQHAVTVADAEHGSVTVDKTQAEQDDEVKVTAVTPDEGYELDTLTYTPEGGSATDIVDNTFVMPPSDVTVTATFKAKKYNITFVNYDGSELQTETLDYGATPTYKGAKPTRPATAEATYTFAGWTPAVATVTGAATYTATYTTTPIVKTCTLTFDPAGGTYKGSTAKFTILANVGDIITIPNAPTRSGYTFVCWQGSEYQPGDQYEATGDHTFTASWKKKTTTTYTIAFEPNGGTGNMDDLTVVAGSSTTLTGNKFSRSGYVFTGWNTAKDGTGTDYRNKASIVPSGNLTLYAQWHAIVTPKPTMSNSKGGGFASRTDEITFTILQKVPDDATSMKIWVDLEPVLYYTTTVDGVTVKTTDGDAVSASVSIEGQRLAVTVGDASVLRGQTVSVAYRARVRTNADLSAYLNASKDTASIPYQAHTTFNGAVSRTVESDKESFKVRVGSTSNSTTGTTVRSVTRAATARTSDPTSAATFAVLTAAGLGFSVAGAKRRK